MENEIKFLTHTTSKKNPFSVNVNVKDNFYNFKVLFEIIWKKEKHTTLS